MLDTIKFKRTLVHFHVCCAVAALLINIVAGLRADVLRVPQEYLTIQGALNAVADDDTVLVSLGTYAEELHAPPLRFWLIGDVEIDTGDFPKPVIDPSTLDSAQWRRCIAVPAGCELSIDRMAFVNRAAMYPRQEEFSTGGIFSESELLLSIRFCSFDSVYRAIANPSTDLDQHYVIEDSRFTNANRSQICPFDYQKIEVRRSFFHGRNFFSAFVYAGIGSTIEECIFTGDSIAGAISLQGTENGAAMLVRNCIFGPIDTCVNRVLDVSNSEETMIELNIFHDIQSQWDIAVLHYSGYMEHEPVIFRHNQLLDISSWSGGASAIYVSRNAVLPPGVSAQIDSNVFEHFTLQQSAFHGKALSLATQISATGNRFVNLQPLSMPVMGANAFNFAASTFRYNRFDVEDYAIYTPVFAMDAIHNYWGDPSGPFNFNHNPLGLGARVDDPVLFIPWSPDTNFLVTPKPHAPLPLEISLDVFPNPFNASASLKFYVSQPGIFQIDLFNMLGQHVRKLWSGAAVYEQQITIDGSALPSGLYFVRAWQMIENRPVVLQKVVLAK